MDVNKVVDAVFRLSAMSGNHPLNVLCDMQRACGLTDRETNEVASQMWKRRGEQTHYIPSPTLLMTTNTSFVLGDEPIRFGKG